MNKILIIVILLLLVGAISYYLISVEEEAKPTIQYTKPIGPTQEYPYRLDSKLLETRING